MDEVVAQLKSAYLQNERTIWIRPPRERASAAHLTVFLDGELYRERVEAVSVIESLEGSIADSWFVFVSMESEEARWRECPCHAPFAKFVGEELMPWIEARLPEVKSARHRTLVGLSYTGLAAAFVAKECPGLFQKVISQSGSFWWRDCWLEQQYRNGSPVPAEFYLEVGTDEVQENLQHRPDVLQTVSQIEGVRRFRDALKAGGHTVIYTEIKGGHHFAVWKQGLPEALRWALPRPKPDEQER
jgi:enterochelin esterase family protein